MTQIIIAAGILGLFALFGSVLLLMVRGRQRDARAAEEARRVSEARATSLEQTIAQLVGAQSEIKGQVSELSKVHIDAQSRTMKVLEERFDGITGKMNVSLKESGEKTAESLGQLKTRLEVIDGAQKNITELSSQVVSLQHVLDNKQSRGAFGEVRMKDIFMDALPSSAYKFQATLQNGKRPDALIILPSPHVPIAVDSKFPLEPWKAMQDVDDGEAPVIAQRAFRQAMKKHIKDISTKYIVPNETSESAFMFIPSEAIYAELHSEYLDIVDESYRARVWIVSPSTLMATLNTVCAILKDAAMQEQAHLIQAEVGKMMEDVKRLDERVSDLQKHFGGAEKDIQKIVKSSEKVLRRGVKIESLHLEDKSIDSNADTLILGQDPEIGLSD